MMTERFNRQRRLRGCTKTKPFPNEPPSVHTIPEGVLVILSKFIEIIDFVTIIFYLITKTMKSMKIMS